MSSNHAPAPGPADAGRHQDGAREHGSGLEEEFAGIVLGFLGALPQAVEQQLPHDEAAITRLPVEQVRIPLAETVVGPFVGGMPEVVRARVERELVEQRQVEVGVGADRLGGGFENLQRALDEIVILPARHADAAQEQRDGADAFVVVDFAALLIFEHGNRTMADVIVELLDGAGHDAVGFGPRPRWPSTASQTRTRKNGCHRSASF